MSLTAVVEADREQAFPCHRVDPDLFFAESPVDVERAKALCIDCPIRSTCLAEALERREPRMSGLLSYLVASWFCRVWWCRASGPAVARARTRSPHDRRLPRNAAADERSAAYRKHTSFRRNHHVAAQ